MQEYIPRQLEKSVLRYLSVFPAVAILGPRQVGKSTLAKKMGLQLERFLYLDLQNYEDLNRLTEPALFFETNKDSVVCIDEIQLKPDLFSILRSVIDKNRRNGRFILLGSASPDIIGKASESLAGRIGFIHLTPFLISEITKRESYTLQRYWLRGGFPESYLALSDSNSRLWLENFIRTYIERDLPQIAFKIPPPLMRRLMHMCAHNQGQMLNSSKLASSLGLTQPTVRRYIDLLEQTFLMRLLLPYEQNIKKRLVKSPKTYIRDSGILHSLLGISDFNNLLGHPVFGASWEGLVIENCIENMSDWTPSFYRTSGGNEIDLILVRNAQKIAVECKASAAPQLNKGNWSALEDIKPDHTLIIAPISDQSYQLSQGILVSGLPEAISILQKWSEG